MNSNLRILTLQGMLILVLGLTACVGQGVAPSATLVPTATSMPTTPAGEESKPGVPSASPTLAPTTTPTAPDTGSLPLFSDPTSVTNPFFPVSLSGQTISLGTEGDEAYRTEVTLLPETRQITWEGGTTEVLIAQYVAYADGHLVEIAYDYFAQADNGDVYYFGEDVYNYEDGQVVDQEGSWLAGKDGAPPALIMPAQPQVGMVFNPENLPGVVYETDEVISQAEKTTTPGGPISDGLLIKETLMDGSIEYKVYAAGFGVVEERAEDAQVNLVLMNQAGASSGVVPDQLQTIKAQAEDIIDIVPAGNLTQVTADVAAIAQAWQAYQPEAATDGAPQAFQDALASALESLQAASQAKDAAGTMQAANDLSAAVVDLFAVYHPALPADLGRLGVLERQVVLDVTANDLTAAADSLAQVNAVWARLKPFVLAINGSDVAAQFDASLSTQATALSASDAAALTAEADNGLELVDALEQLY